MSVAPQSTETPPLRSARRTTPECGMLFQYTAVPAPVMYAEQARPTPRRREPPPARRARFSRQPDASTTRSMHSPRPIVVTVRWFAVFV